MYVFTWLLSLAAVLLCLEADPQLHIKWGQASSTKHSLLGTVLRPSSSLFSRPSYDDLDDDDHHHHHHDDYDYSSYGTGQGGGSHYGDYEDYSYDDGSDYDGPSRRCSCLLYVQYTQVFQRTQTSSWFSCNQRGLERCSRYCRNLFRDERLRASSRQDACDVLGRRVDSRWYRKEQVCGSGGLSRDVAMPVDLCCIRGRPSSAC